MIRSDFHTHTTFCDGKNTAEEMVQAAIAKGMTCLGFSMHSELRYLDGKDVVEGKSPAYRAEIARLKEKYRDQIEILCGIELELDMQKPLDLAPFDYAIGSVHYLEKNGQTVFVDYSPEIWKKAVDELYGGDPIALAEHYFENVARLSARKINIIGHFDLCAKFNGDGKYFDERDPRYLSAAFGAVDALLPLGIPFEINTGAIARGLRTCPYPNTEILRYIGEHGGFVVFNSDSHKAKTLCFEFDRWEDEVRRLVPVADDWRP